MKLRTTITIDVEVDDHEAMQEFGTADAHAACRELQQEANERMQELVGQRRPGSPGSVLNASVVVVPLYG